MIVVDGEPEEDASLFSDPHNIKMVMKRGIIAKNIL